MLSKKEYLTQELDRYNDQLKALEKDDSYKLHEEKRRELQVFYQNKIEELSKTLKKMQA